MSAKVHEVTVEEMVNEAKTWIDAGQVDAADHVLCRLIERLKKRHSQPRPNYRLEFVRTGSRRWQSRCGRFRIKPDDSSRDVLYSLEARSPRRGWYHVLTSDDFEQVVHTARGWAA